MILGILAAAHSSTGSSRRAKLDQLAFSVACKLMLCKDCKQKERKGTLPPSLFFRLFVVNAIDPFERLSFQLHTASAFKAYCLAKLPKFIGIGCQQSAAHPLQGFWPQTGHQTKCFRPPTTPFQLWGIIKSPTGPASQTGWMAGGHWMATWSPSASRTTGKPGKIETQVDAEETKVNPRCLELFQNKKKGADPQ